jgi:hypothetical protein
MQGGQGSASECRGLGLTLGLVGVDGQGLAKKVRVGRSVPDYFLDYVEVHVYLVMLFAMYNVQCTEYEGGTWYKV